MTAADTRAFSLAAALILAASGLRYGVERTRGPSLAWDSASAAPELLDASEAEREAEEQRRRPLGPNERLDPNRASAAELDRLPGVGPGTAEAIVQARSDGPFRTADDLLRVRGVGPATLEKIRAHLELPVGPSSGGRGREPSSRSRVSSPGAARAGNGGRTGSGASVARGGPRAAGGGQPGSAAPVDLNRADGPTLESLPGIGPALAGRILEVRERLGGFRSVDQLTEVPGIGPATLDRLRPLVRVAR